MPRDYQFFPGESKRAVQKTPPSANNLPNLKPEAPRFEVAEPRDAVYKMLKDRLFRAGYHDAALTLRNRWHEYSPRVIANIVNVWSNIDL